MAAEAWPRWQRQRPAPGGPLRVSYVTVVRNAAATVERTLQSVQAQTWPHVEHVVLDGASTDGTWALVQRHAARLAHAASAPDGGLYEALNQALGWTTGDLVCVLNADDWLTPDAAANAAAAAGEARGDTALLVCSAAWVESRGQAPHLWLPEPLTAASLLTCANICHNGVYATPAAYAATGPYRTDLRIAGDFAWLVAGVRAGVAVRRSDQPTVHYSLGGMSGDTLRHTRECVQVLRQAVPALSEEEAWGLLHCFHQPAWRMDAFAASRPPHRGRFLQALAQRHEGDALLMRALAQAAAAVLQHPADDRPAGKLSRSEKWRRSLRKRWIALTGR
ncbi:hypothetical protein RA210_U40376 [Rubrivivax sp. A210]|uniref:glycosyltransferase n=1 Tax=Rubrivivax sp. A210 TaxID=2772301 RepID=UPI0019198932|nr:glycosyltransferase [Rubrivivax sp. A210]CAD5373973.1 hypothetical protein RA210_U40376 [Rubrivivax sp. A210]